MTSSDEADDESPLIPIGSGGGASPCKVAGIIGRYATPSTVDTDITGHAPDGEALDSGGGDETGSIEDTVAVSNDEGDPVAPAPATTSFLSPTSTWMKLRDGDHGTTHGCDEDSELRPSCPKLSVRVFSHTCAAATPPEIGDCVSSTTLLLPPTLPSSSSTSRPQDGPGREKQQQELRATVSPPWPSVSSATFGPLSDTAPSDEAGLVSSAACGMDRLRLAESKPRLPPVVELGIDQIWNGWDAGRVFNEKALERPYYPRAVKA